MSSILSSLRSMHLVETLAVSLYHWPQTRLQKKNRPLYQAFISFEEGEKRHQALFLEGLSTHDAKPFLFASPLGFFVGAISSLICFFLGLRVLLYFELLIEWIAIQHYEKILQRGLPEPWQSRVREVQQDERLHLQEMKQWLKRL